MTEKDLSQNILDKIKDKKVKPKPSWEFALKDSLLLIFLFLFLLIGSLASSVIIYMIDNNDWDLYKKINDSIFAFILSSLPYFWLVVLLLFLTMVFYNFKQTKSGYKYRSYSIIMTCVLISIILGFIFYNIGLAQTIDSVFDEKIPLYRKIQQNMQANTANPEKGVLIGKPAEVINQQQIIVVDMNNKKWYVLVENRPIQPQIIEFPRPVIFVGQKVDEDNFIADMIRPLKCRTGNCLHAQLFKQLFEIDERNLNLMRINN